MDISGQVLAVTGRNVNVTKGPRPGPKVIYDIVFSDGNTYVSWTADKATLAQQLLGQQVDIRVEVTQSGEFTNYKLLDIAPTGQLEAVGALLSPSQPVGNGAAPPIPMAPEKPSYGGMSPERESKIVKQSCLSTAFNFIGLINDRDGTAELDEVVQDALELAKTLYAEVYGQENVASTPQTSAEVAAIVNHHAGSEVVKVGADTPPW